MKLSILICSVNNRLTNFLPNVISKLDKQCANYDDVEIITLIDNKRIMLGDKRNMLINLAAGEYVVFIDDDDDITDDYVSTLYDAIESKADVITFIVDVSLNNQPCKPCFYSIKHKEDYNTDYAYYRLPNHIMCIKRSICLDTPYKAIIRGEDAAFSKDILPKLKSEYAINKALYKYLFNQATTETQQYTIR